MNDLECLKFFILAADSMIHPEDLEIALGGLKSKKDLYQFVKKEVKDYQRNTRCHCDHCIAGVSDEYGHFWTGDND